MKHFTLFLLWAATLSAAPVLTLQPPAAVSGPPGSTVGWAFELTPDDTAWITVISSFVVNESNGSLGVYTDLIGPQGGPVGGLLPPSPQSPWAGDLGSYTIDPLAVAGAVNTGTIRVLYERYSDDPAACGDCYIDSGEWDLAFTVSVEDSSVPEPGPWVLVATGIGAIALRRMRYHAPHVQKAPRWTGRRGRCIRGGGGDAAGAV